MLYGGHSRFRRLNSSCFTIYFKRFNEKENCTLREKQISGDNLIITISRQHGTRAKTIGRMFADKLKIKFYDKGLAILEVKKRGFDKKHVKENSDEYGCNDYISLDANKDIRCQNFE